RGLDNVLLAIHDAVIAAGIAPGHVARMEPAIAQYGAGCVRVFEVALHDLRPADDQLADFPNRHFLASVNGIDDAGLRVREGQANGAGSVARAKRIYVGNGARLREAVSFADRRHAVALEFGADFRIQGRCSGNDAANEIEPPRPLSQYTVEGVEHGGHGGDELDALPFQQLDYGFALEAWIEMDRGCLGPRRQQRRA